MASISIKERIERELLVRAATVDGVGAVNRWDSRKRDQTNYNITVVTGEEDAAEGSIGGDNGETTKRTLHCAALVLVAQSEADALSSAAVHNTWLARLQDIFLNDSTLLETPTPNQNLTINISEVRTSNPPAVDDPGEFFAALEFDVLYETMKANPYIGPGITLLTE